MGRGVPYESNHKYIDGIEYKLCSRCDEWILMNEDHFYKNKANNIDGYFPYCKECVSKKHQENKEENNRRANEYNKNNPHILRECYRRHRINNIEKVSAKHKKWRHENRDKLVEYRLKRMNKDHEITEKEWTDCKEYFNNSCAYCGISEVVAKEKYNNVLHKEHVDHEGSNGIDNCVPSCKSCNSTKNIKGFEEWYNENNQIYNQERYDTIIEWLSIFIE